MWVAIPVAWIEVAPVVLVMGDGELDAFLAIFLGGTGLAWTVTFVAAALYMRSARVVTYFTAITDGHSVAPDS